MSSFLTAAIQNRTATTIATNPRQTSSTTTLPLLGTRPQIQMHFFPLTCLGAIAASTALGKAEARVLFHSTAGFLTTSTPFRSRSAAAAGTIWTSRSHAAPIAHAAGPSVAPERKAGDISDFPDDGPPSPRIAVIGGGIAGVTAARSIAKELATSDKSVIKKADIVIYEGDANGGPLKERFDIQRKAQPIWGSATAKNANSLVPGVAMHVMSKRSTLIEIAEDTINEWLMLKLEALKGFVSASLVPIKKVDDFSAVPPYFAFHPLKCLGPTATMEERWTFLTFLRHFVVTSLLSGEIETHDRGLFIYQLAKANREILRRDIAEIDALPEKIGLGNGFMSLYRTKAKAEFAANEATEHGETSQTLTWEEATELEPRIKNLPIEALYATHRPNDNTANCATYIREIIRECEEDLGITYMRDEGSKVVDVFRLQPLNVPKFRVTLTDGSFSDYDYVVLAAGIRTPLIARKLGIGASCPTYPLRGFSLTLYTDARSDKEMKTLEAQGKSTNLLNRPISIDAMYCSSVGPNMARIAGFGELVGYGDKVKDVPSVGPRVMTRYVRSLFPEAKIADDQAIQCFRPLSPDDLPLVGEVDRIPGLFLHTGHGTLGWTMSLATGQCVAQAVRDRVNNVQAEKEFVLEDGSRIDRDVLSPNRFTRSLMAPVRYMYKSGGGGGDDEKMKTSSHVTPLAEAAGGAGPKK